MRVFYNDLTRKQALTRLEALGYAGPVSYSVDMLNLIVIWIEMAGTLPWPVVNSIEWYADRTQDWCGTA
jgi:hypothetical protein